MTSDEVEALVENIRTFNREGQRAPNKPLLLLLALAWIQHEKSRILPFTAYEKPLRDLLSKFGPSRASPQAGYPFWRLQADGLWEVPDGEDLRQRVSNTDPPVTELRKVTGGFRSSVYDTLRRQPALLSKLAAELLRRHFPSTYHYAIAECVGLKLDPIGVSSTLDPAFRTAVLKAYGCKCAICGLYDPSPICVIVEAVHIRWPCCGGPSTLDNGLCLCRIHQYAFDFGWVTISRDGAIMVSSSVSRDSDFQRVFCSFDGPSTAKMTPVIPFSVNTQRFLDWHNREVYKE
jgi:putative restriction endonuclease